MNAIRSVFAAFTNLAASINALASVIDATTGRLRHTLTLEDAGHVIEHSPATVSPGTVDADSTPTTKRGKGKGAA
jgi:hypothetical protein